MRLRKLGRRSEHFNALMKNLTISLVKHGAICTTIPKIKRLQRYIDPLITIAKNSNEDNDLTSRRRILSAVNNDRDVTNKLMEIGKLSRGGNGKEERRGGYVSYKRVSIRKGDCSVVARAHIIDYPNETLDSSSRSDDFVESGESQATITAE